jgi:hypothetical protein
MADIYFFADQATIDSQQGSPGDEAFGPVGSSETTKFRVTSLHKGIAGANPDAYAVCNGRVRVQADGTDATLVTLVLTPDVEVLRSVPIRFFVYRGIRKDSLIDSAGALVPGALTNRLLNDNDASNDVPDALGLAFRPAAASPPSPDFAREDADPIDTIFFETTTLKAIPVQAGDQLGAFDGVGFGFEIMVGTIWDPPALKLLRTVQVSGRLAQPPIGNILEILPNTAIHVERALREKVYGYLDPCAFFGMCFDKKSRLKYKIASPASKASADSPQVLYDKLLVKFHNRNKVYLDLRNDNGLSYNYYDTYGSGDILLGLDSSSLKRRRAENAVLDSATQRKSYATSGWPLKIIDASSFTVPVGEGKVGIRLAMNTGEALTDAVQRRVFFEFAYLYYNTKGKKRRSHLFEPRRVDRLPDDIKRDIWTADVVLGIPTVTISTLTGSATLPISFCVRLRYLRQNEARPAGAGRYINTEGQWDNLFVLQSNPTQWKNDNLTSWWLTGHLKFVQPQLENQQVFKGIVETGIAVDRDVVSMNDARVTFYYVPIHVDPEPTMYSVTSGENAAGTGGGIGATNSFFQRKESGQLYDGSGTLKLIKASEYKGSGAPSNPASYLTFLTFVENPEAPDPVVAANRSKESIYALSFSAAEYATMLGLAASQAFDPSLHPVFLQARSKLYPRNDETQTERSYQALELRIVGFDANGSYLEFDIPSSGVGSVRPLSLHSDGMIFCTNDAALFEPLPIRWDYNTICTQIRHSSMQGVANDSGHANDVKYFGRAIADIKRYHPEFYGRMERLQLLGAEVILHDSPGAKQRRVYRIEVAFDNSMAVPADPSGDTSAKLYYKGIFPGTVVSVDSNTGFRITQLSTLPTLANSAAATAYNRYLELNATRYVDLNRNRQLNSSQVNELFLTDYTATEIASNLFNPSKLYVESYWNPTGSGVSIDYKRITLNELKHLGFGTLDPEQPITIRINRPEAINKLDTYVLSYTDHNGNAATVNVKNYDPHREFVSHTLAHELGHAEASVKEPLVSFLWVVLHSIFNNAVDDIRITPIVSKINTASLNQFKNWKLLSSYPNPGVISKQINDAKPALNAQLKTEGFLAMTGSGHLRGSPNAQNACLVERSITYPMNRDINKAIIAAIPKYFAPVSKSYKPDTDSTYPGDTVLEVPVDYCFLNFEDAVLK